MDLSELRSFLEAKFELQEQLLRQLRDEVVMQEDVRHTVLPRESFFDMQDVPVPAFPLNGEESEHSEHNGAYEPIMNSQPLDGSAGSGSVVKVFTEEDLPVVLPENQPTVRQQRATRRMESMRRGSSRVSFVRHAMIPMHLKANEAASRLTFIRSGIRKTSKERPLSWREKLEAFVTSNRFNNFIMALIVSNAVLLGVEIDVSARLGQNDIPPWFGWLNTITVFVFVGETALKLLAYGCHEFWRGSECVWNIFDFGVVSVSVVETIVDYLALSMSSTAESNSFRVMRALRLARTLRGVRIIRLFRYFSALRALILSIFSTLGSLLWTLLLLLIIFYIFSCIFTQLVTDHCRFQTIETTQNINAVPKCGDDLRYWDNVMDSMVTLFMAITGGVNWEECYLPLSQVSQLAQGLMQLYIVIGFFTILNVVTGVFVNTAIESASADKDIATLKQMHKRIAHKEALQQIFQEIDDSNANQVSIDELEEALSENKLGNFMESLGISTDDIWSLFVLIDADDNGIVDLDEFVSGCMQLHGPAKSLQVAKMSYENKVTRQAIKHLGEDLLEIKRLMLAGLRMKAPRGTMVSHEL